MKEIPGRIELIAPHNVGAMYPLEFSAVPGQATASNRNAFHGSEFA